MQTGEEIIEAAEQTPAAEPEADVVSGAEEQQAEAEHYQNQSDDTAAAHFAPCILQTFPNGVGDTGTDGLGACGGAGNGAEDLFCLALSAPLKQFDQDEHDAKRHGAQEHESGKNPEDFGIKFLMFFVAHGSSSGITYCLYHTSPGRKSKCAGQKFPGEVVTVL